MTATVTLPTAWLEFPSGERHALGEKTTSIGRAPGNRVILASERVSRNHAAIRREADGTYVLLDFGSSNGTFLNGQRVQQPTTLHNGWVIEIGLQKIIFHTPPVVEASAGAGEATTKEAWLLAISAAILGCREPSEDLAEKTYVGWSTRVQGVIMRCRGRMLRARGEGLLAYWPVASGDARVASVLEAIRSLAGLPRGQEEIRMSLHFGAITLQKTAAGKEAPSGPEVIAGLQLDRMARGPEVPILLSGAAFDALEGSAGMRRLTVDELRGYAGEQRFYTVEGIA